LFKPLFPYTSFYNCLDVHFDFFFNSTLKARRATLGAIKTLLRVLGDLRSVIGGFFSFYHKGYKGIERGDSLEKDAEV
jgi:hypothetical protein